MTDFLDLTRAERRELYRLVEELTVTLDARQFTIDQFLIAVRLMNGMHTPPDRTMASRSQEHPFGTH